MNLEGSMEGDLQAERQKEIRRDAKKAYSLVGFSLVVMFLISLAGQQIISIIAESFGANLMEEPWIYANFLFLYVIGIPLGLLMMRKLPKENIAPSTLKFGDLLKIFTICVSSMYIGNLIGLGFTSVFSALTGKAPINSVVELISENSIWLSILIMVIAAPIVEELLFRKFLIDRLRIYGEKHAVVATALLFGLFHMNFFQFFYAFFLGLIFGYVYLRTGKIRYTIIYHMMINFMGSVIATRLAQGLTTIETNPEEAILSGFMIAAYGLFLLVLVIVGVIFLILSRKKIIFMQTEKEIQNPKKLSVIYANAGMLVMILFSLILMVLTLFVVTA